MNKRISRLGKITAVASGLALVMTACGGTDEELDFMVDVAYVPKHAPFFGAVERGFFEDEGLTVNLMQGSGSADTVAAVDTGQIDAGWADFATTVLNIGTGAEIKQTNLIMGRSANATVALESSGIEQWDDLRGTTVATEGGGSMIPLWPMVESAVGFDEDDVEVISVASESKISGLLAGQWDANLSLSVTDVPVLVGEGEEPVVLDWGDHGVEFYGHGIIFSEETLENEPETVEAFNRALQKGFLWACDNPNETAQDFMGSIEGFSEDVVLAGIEAQCDRNWNEDSETNGYGHMTEEGVQGVIDIADEWLGLEEDADLSPEDVYSPDFLTETILPDETVEEPQQ